MYTEIVTQILSEGNIPFSQDRSMGMVFVFYEGRLGEIFSMYDCLEEGVISNFSLYAFSVPKSKYREVSEYLSQLNKPLSVNFYIDKDTDCIAFSSEYKIPTEGCNREDLSAFCLDTHHTCLSYQSVLYRILEKCGVKNIKVVNC